MHVKNKDFQERKFGLFLDQLEWKCNGYVIKVVAVSSLILPPVQFALCNALELIVNMLLCMPCMYVDTVIVYMLPVQGV